MNCAKSPGAQRARTSSRVTATPCRLASSTTVAGSIEPSRCKCNSALGREARKFSSDAVSTVCNSGFLPQHTALAAVAEVNDETDGEPNEEANPVHDGQACHQQEASEDRRDRRERSSRRPECARPIRLTIPQNQYTRGDERKGEQR